ncbi:MAG TPA: 2-isopropylmalate synthase [Blastocatellia bacterium]|nr:2-isopropylmalate synthase [Blastocatellia bacterium]
MPDRVMIFDTTLRDGEQSPGCSMNLEEKLRMAAQLEALGVDIIEAGFPVASDDDFASVREIARSCRRAAVAGLARALPADIDRAWEALKGADRPRIHTFLATSDIHLEYKLKITREQALAQIEHAVRHARRLAPDVEFSPEDATRTDIDFLCKAVETAIRAGATTINIPDTVGYITPGEFTEILRTLKERVDGIERVTLSAHCHNDLGLAVANSIAAIEAGARQVECTINGIGERAGNASLEEIVMALWVRQDRLQYSTGIVTQEIHRTSQLLSNITGIAVQPNKAIVGRNAFAHEAGIHQHGVIANSLTYEIMRPETVGALKSTLVLGKHSGRHALQKRYEEMGFTLSRAELDKAYKLFTKLADQKKDIFDEDLLAIIQDGLREIPETFKLRSVEAVAGTSKRSWASVTLEKDGQLMSRTGEAAGPVAATYDVIDFLTGMQGRLIDYSVHSVTRGIDAVGEVFTHVEFDGRLFTGRAASTDVIEASARAYLHAVNKAVHARNNRAQECAATASGERAFIGAAD